MTRPIDRCVRRSRIFIESMKRPWRICRCRWACRSACARQRGRIDKFNEGIDQMKRSWCYALVLLLLSAAAAPIRADEIDELRQLRDTTIALVNALVEQGVLSRQKAD